MVGHDHIAGRRSGPGQRPVAIGAPADSRRVLPRKSISSFTRSLRGDSRPSILYLVTVAHLAVEVMLTAKMTRWLLPRHSGTLMPPAGTLVHRLRRWQLPRRLTRSAMVGNDAPNPCLVLRAATRYFALPTEPYQGWSGKDTQTTALITPSALVGRTGPPLDSHSIPIAITSFGGESWK